MLNSNFTWQGLKELLDLIAGCGYFERVQEEAGKVSETGPVGDAEFEVVEHTDVPAPDSDEVQASLPPDVPEEVEPLPDSTQQKQVLTVSCTFRHMDTATLHWLGQILHL